MSNSLFEPGEFFLIEGQLFDQHIEIASLVAQIHSKTEGVVNDEHRENNR